MYGLGLESTLDDLVQVDVRLAVNILWPQLFSSSIRKSSWNHSSQCGIIPLCQVLQKVTSVLVAIFIRQNSSVIRIITSVPSV